MNTNLRTGIFSLAVLFAGGGLFACTTQAANGATGGSGGTASGTGGSGTGTGGATSGTGGAGGAFAASAGIACLPPASTGLITDFTYLPGDAAAPVTDQVHFGDDNTTLSGGEFVYPNSTATGNAYQLTSNVTGSNWHITAANGVGDYSGFGFFFDSCTTPGTCPNGCNRIDATGFTGISFTISGTVLGNALTFEVDTLNDTIAPSWLNTHGGTAATTDPGACNPGGTATTTQYTQSVCAEPTTTIPVSSTTPTKVTVHWTDFTNGKTDASPKATDIVGIRWVLPVPAGVGGTGVTTYPLDLTVDNIMFVTQ